MKLLGNIIWIIFGGIEIAFQYLIAGCILCITIIGIPYGWQCFKLAGIALFPFGQKVKMGKIYMGCLMLPFNLIWFVLAGLWIFLSHLFFALLLTITIVGVPFAVQHLKLARLAIFPFGTQID